MRDETPPLKKKIRVATYRQGQEPKERKIIMKNLFAVNFAENTIVVSKTTLKKASIPNSAEYKALMKLMKQNPTFTVAEKEIKKAEGKNTYKGLNEAFIKQYISIQTNAKTLDEQYKKAAEMGKFPLVRKWFLDTFKNFDMATAKDEIEKAILAQIGSVSISAAENKPALIAMSEQKMTA